MEIDRHHNWAYDGGAPDIPHFVGDRWYGQDIVRDLQWLENETRRITDILTAVPVLFSGGRFVQGVGDTLDTVQTIGYHYADIKIPASYASLPPTVTTVQKLVRVLMPPQTNFPIASATLDGSTVNYVKLLYAETSSPTRGRAKKAGTYVFAVFPSFSLTVDAVAPAGQEILLGTLIGNTGGPYTITYANPHGDSTGIVFHNNQISNDSAHHARRMALPGN